MLRARAFCAKTVDGANEKKSEERTDQTTETYTQKPRSRGSKYYYYTHSKLSPALNLFNTSARQAWRWLALDTASRFDR